MIVLSVASKLIKTAFIYTHARFCRSTCIIGVLSHHFQSASVFSLTNKQFLKRLIFAHFQSHTDKRRKLDMYMTSFSISLIAVLFLSIVRVSAQLFPLDNLPETSH